MEQLSFSRMFLQTSAQYVVRHIPIRMLLVGCFKLPTRKHKKAPGKNLFSMLPEGMFLAETLLVVPLHCPTTRGRGHTGPMPIKGFQPGMGHSLMGQLP